MLAKKRKNYKLNNYTYNFITIAIYFWRTPFLSEEWIPFIAPIQNFRDQQTPLGWGCSRKKVYQWWRPQVITESSHFWPHRGPFSHFSLQARWWFWSPHQLWFTPPRNFNDHVQAQNATMCADAALREQQTPKLWSPPTDAVKLLSFQKPPSWASFQLLCISFFLGHQHFSTVCMFSNQTSVIPSCMFAKWNPELFSICFNFSDNSVIQHVKTFNINPEVSESCADIKVMSAQCLCPASFIKAGKDPV